MTPTLIPRVVIHVFRTEHLSPYTGFIYLTPSAGEGIKAVREPIRRRCDYH